MKSWTIFKSHIIPLAKMRLLLRPVMRSLIVPQYALECLKMPSGTIRENRTRWTQFAYFQSINYSIFFLVKVWFSPPTTPYKRGGINRGLTPNPL